MKSLIDHAQFFAVLGVLALVILLLVESVEAMNKADRAYLNGRVERHATQAAFTEE